MLGGIPRAYATEEKAVFGNRESVLESPRSLKNYL